jgi:predicted transcriptional regulator|tara:strand:- start:719 stop:994 length:276 start_codon:yes stop_codon:yes gene_type:complete
MIVLAYLDIKESILLKANDTTFKVLHIILNQIDEESGIWYADKIHKKEIMNNLDITITTLDKHIASLKKRELIIREITRGRYKLNSEIFSI